MLVAISRYHLTGPTPSSIFGIRLHVVITPFPFGFFSSLGAPRGVREFGTEKIVDRIIRELPRQTIPNEITKGWRCPTDVGGEIGPAT
jgi:hypothetical protein